MYRSPNGNKCAIGCLIGDTRYSDGIEGGGINSSSVRRCLSPAFEKAAFRMMMDVQSFHDNLDHSTDHPFTNDKAVSFFDNIQDKIDDGSFIDGKVGEE